MWDNSTKTYYNISMRQMKVKFTENKEDFNKYKKDVWNMLILSYEKVEGGLLSYRNFEDFEDRKHSLKIVEYPDLIACATYRHFNVKNTDILKLVAIGCDQTNSGKEGLKLIVRDDIKSEGYIFWAEVSGTIEHYFEKYNGYKIANCYASEILGRDDLILDNDGFHYTRKIGNGNAYSKVIFGFRDDDTFKKVNEYINLCLPQERFTEKSKEEVYTQLTLAYDILEAIYSANEDSGVYELFPNWYDYLIKARYTISKYEIDLKRKDYYLEEADFLLDTMPLIELKPLIIN